jgi:hypothetical protein
VIIWDFNTNRPTALNGHTDMVYDVTWSPDGTHLASGGMDQNMIIWDPTTGQSINLRHNGVILCVAWSPDGNYLASATDQTVIVWDVETHQPLANLEGNHTDQIFDVAWSPDGTRLVSASKDQTLVVWDLASKSPDAILQGHQDEIYSVAWSPDGQQLASASADQTVRVLDTAFLQPSCNWVTRNLSLAEWVKYMPNDVPYHRTCPNHSLHPDIVEAAQELARTGRIGKAVTQIRHLLTGDPGDPVAKIKQLIPEIVQDLLADGEKQAKNGKVKEALLSFQQAKQLDPSLDLDPGAEVRRLIKPAFEETLKNALDFAGTGYGESAEAKFEEASKLVTGLNSAEACHRLCVAGTRQGFAKTVLTACDAAIALDEKNGLYYNSRGIARLQVGDQAGAQADFAEFENWLADR